MLIRSSESLGIIVRRFFAHLSGAAALLALCAGCGDDELTRPPSPCSGPVTLTVSAGTSPDFLWMPACGVARLVVLAPPSPDVFADTWTIRAPEAIIGPPVHYGRVPIGSTEDRPAEPLRSGETYRASVFGVAGMSLASVSFVP